MEPVKPMLETSAAQTPFCGNLRSKKYFMLDVVATEAHQYIDESGWCWCSKTQQVLGPDGDHALPEKCGPGRACYRSALSIMTR